MPIKKLSLSAVLSLAGATAVHAAPFGPATASLGSFDVPTVVINGGNGSDTIQLNGGSAQLSSGTGTFANGTFAGSGTGTLTFFEAPGTVTNGPVSGLFKFNDNQGGFYQFDLRQIDTVGFSNASRSTSISLYLLGSAFDTNLGLTSSDTSLTMTFNSTAGSSYSESGSLANPPADVPVVPSIPEPASLALLGAGLASVGLLRRKRHAS